LNDVVARDIEIHTQLADAFTGILTNTNNIPAGQISDVVDPVQRRFYQIAHTLFGITINDEDGRQVTLYEDLSNNSVFADGTPKTSVTIPLKFVVGDAIALRISYAAKSSPVDGQGMGSNTISPRSYKILLQMV